MTNSIDDPKLKRLLARLHRKSDVQQKAMDKYIAGQRSKRKGPPAPDVIKKFLSDKLVALEPDKAQFCYQLCRALGAARIVEVGTSHGVSTLYLAAAARDNARENGKKCIVIGTEYEPAKAKAARINFAKAGLSEFVDLREGDLRETLSDLRGPIDFVLMDIWGNMAGPAIKLLAPALHAGSTVVCDNTRAARYEYDEYFAFIANPVNRLRSMTLPFRGGFELTVRT